MPLSVLLYALFYLPLRRLHAIAAAGAVALSGLGAVGVGVGGGRGRRGLLVAVDGGGEAEVVGGGVSFFETALDLYHGLLDEDELVLKAFKNL